MRIETLVVLLLTACIGTDPPGSGGGVEQLTVRARTLEPGPHPENSIVELAAEASGGIGPYLYSWKEPAVTIDSFRGSGRIDSGELGTVATVAVVDSLGYAATDSIAIEVEGTLSLAIEIEGPGRVDAGELGACTQRRCTFVVRQARKMELTAIPFGDAGFLGWSGCSSSTEASIAIQLASSISCTARFGAGSISCEGAPAPIADFTVRPDLDQPPYDRDASGFYVVPRNTVVAIDGRSSRFFAGEGLSFDWTVTWDPLNEVPEFSVAFFEIRTPGFAGVQSDVVLTLADDCGRTSTATASYITD